ncbi:MAG: hypothetical protein LBS11_11270 [Oscillospiraceae bacterium]|nr:hypothetical protein [Oscillospiraceae bacterium]
MKWFVTYGELRWESPRIRVNNLMAVERHLIPDFGNIPIQKIQTHAVQGPSNQMVDKEFCLGTIQISIGILRSSL